MSSFQRPDPGSDPAPMLAAMGHSVRALRARLGMTRKELASASGVSERYVADVESGRGNVSILILRQLADALGVSPVTLLSAPGDAADERGALVHLIEQMPKTALPRLRRLIETRFVAD